MRNNGAAGGAALGGVLMQDGLKSKERSPSRLVVSIAVVAVLIVAAAILAVVFLANSSEFKKHSPIVIEGNDGFTKANGVVRGRGVETDPYMI
jgi:hypothetical protein